MALVDVNNFYVSCERLFNPYLIDKPVVVLSNNDVCIISRSQEAKDLGIKMGEPLFKVTTMIKQHQVQVLSSNYPLYADISDRVMSLLSGFTDTQEIYSIDECFLNMEGQNNLLDIAQEIKDLLWRYLRMPVCVGIGPTKVLAKFANRCAKKQDQQRGVFMIRDANMSGLHNIMDDLSVDQVWGIGKALSAKLQSKGVYSVWELKHSNPVWMRKVFGINIERIIYELNGISCLLIDNQHVAKQAIRCSRSFGRRVSDYGRLAEAVTTFVGCAALKARKQHTVSNAITIFLSTNPFNKKLRHYQEVITMPLEQPTNHTSLIVKAALDGLRKIYKENVAYSKCGVILNNLEELRKLPYPLITSENKRQVSLTKTIDEINNKFDKYSLRIAFQPLNPSWNMRQAYRSQSYSTSWSDLVSVGC